MIRIKRRKSLSNTFQFLFSFLSIIAALVFGAFFLYIGGVSPLTAYSEMIRGALGSFYNLSEILVKMTPLLLTGLSVGLAFKLRFWNIGAEGQLVMGGIGASAIALLIAPQLSYLPRSLMIVLVIIAGMLFGGVWALIPALLKVYFRVNEVIVTLMLNYIAIFFLQYLFNGPWKDPKGWGFPGSAIFPENAWMPRLSDTRVHMTLLIGVIAAVLIYWILRKTKWGYEIQVIGQNPRAGEYAGINSKYKLLQAMVFCGFLSGLAGVGEVTGVSHRLFEGLAVGYGFTATTVAWLARLNPLAMILVSFLLGVLFVGGEQLQVAMGLPLGTVLIFEGLCLFFILGSDFFTRYTIEFKVKD